MKGERLSHDQKSECVCVNPSVCIKVSFVVNMIMDLTESVNLG